jgi:(2Fe-2S) ferredoxin
MRRARSAGLDGPATRHFRTPREERRLVVCTGCDREGRASEHLALLTQLLIERGLSEESVGIASCVRRNCLGKCCSEPLAHVMPDDVWYRDLTGENLPENIRAARLERATDRGTRPPAGRLRSGPRRALRAPYLLAGKPGDSAGGQGVFP